MVAIVGFDAPAIFEFAYLKRDTIMKLALLATWCCATLAVCPPAAAQTYPGKVIQVIVPMQAGSAGDVTVRILAQKIATSIGQSLVVENVAGAAGSIGAERLARAPADGYTIGAMGDSMLTQVPHLQARINYDPLTSFEPVGVVASVTMVLVVHPAVAAANLGELAALAKARPGTLDYASAGIGSPQHVGMELFKDLTGAALTHVPFRGAAQAALDVVSGRIPVMLTALSVALPFVRDGRLRALAVASKQRSALLPAVPTAVESGLPGYEFTPWVAIYAPKGTPGAIIDRLNRETGLALADPSVRDRLLALGLEPETSTPGELAVRLKTDHARMGKLIKEVGLKSE